MTDPTYTKHTTHTDALDTLGTILSPDDPNKRDAIHLAVYKVQAGETLRPGDHVYLDDDNRARTVLDDDRDPHAGDREYIGIVDPFLSTGGYLRQYAREGQWFWLVVYPRQITSLRHVWEHPAFPPSGETTTPAPVGATVTIADLETKEEAERWIRDYLDSHGDNPGFDAVMAVIKDGSWTGPENGWDPSTGEYGDGWGDGPYIHFRGVDAHGEISAEFWEHVDVYLGRRVPDDERAVGFSCSC